MRKAALIYNPASGRQRHLRVAKVEAAAAVLRVAGVEANVIATHSPNSGGQQAQQAIAAGYDTIFACGGDGTLNDVLQGVVSETETENEHVTSSLNTAEVALGIVPLGTGNVVASDQGISWDPATAIQQQLQFVPRRIAAGKIEYSERGTSAQKARYFTAMAGVGVDAEMTYRLSVKSKTTFGKLAYYIEMTKLAFMHAYVPFEVEAEDAQTGEKRTAKVFQVAAIRISNFGGPLKRMKLDAALTRDHFQLVLFTSKNRLEHFYFMSGRALGGEWQVPGVDLMSAREIICRPFESAAATSRAGIYAQADGDFLGSIPARITIVPNAFTLLMRPEK
jgi:diacylglycerol kinase family enzyme